MNLTAAKDIARPPAGSDGSVLMPILTGIGTGKSFMSPILSFAPNGSKNALRLPSVTRLSRPEIKHRFSWSLSAAFAHSVGI
jgi:hypothetical protein